MYVDCRRSTNPRKFTTLLAQADSGRGVAIVYRWDASQNLTEAPSFSQTLVSGDPQSGAEFGFSVAVAPSLDGLDSCGYLIVGEPRHGSFEGGVYIYAWSDVARAYSLHQPKLKPVSVGSGDQFGNSLSADDDVLVVGAQGGPGKNGTVGAVLAPACKLQTIEILWKGRNGGVV